MLTVTCNPMGNPMLTRATDLEHTPVPRKIEVTLVKPLASGEAVTLTDVLEALALRGVEVRVEIDDLLQQAFDLGVEAASGCKAFDVRKMADLFRSAGERAREDLRAKLGSTVEEYAAEQEMTPEMVMERLVQTLLKYPCE